MSAKEDLVGVRCDERRAYSSSSGVISSGLGGSDMEARRSSVDLDKRGCICGGGLSLLLREFCLDEPGILGSDA